MSGKLKDHQLEKKLDDYARAVTVRRSLFERRIGRSMADLPKEVRATDAAGFCTCHGMKACLMVFFFISCGDCCGEHFGVVCCSTVVFTALRLLFSSVWHHAVQQKT